MHNVVKFFKKIRLQCNSPLDIFVNRPLCAYLVILCRCAAVLKKAFGMFDQKKTGSIEVNKVAAILNTMGQQFDDDELKTLCDSKAKGQ